MPRILIAGCGYLGQVIADLFNYRGWDVAGWTASEASARELAHKPYPVSACDISDPQKVANCSADFDVVIHSSSTRGGDAELYRQVYLNGIQNLERRFPGSRLVFISSTSVYAQTGGEEVDEQSEANPQHETGKVLRETEKIVLDKGGTVARLAGLYGPGRAFLLKRFLAGEAVIDAQNDRFVNQVHRDDAAAAVFLLVNHPPAAGQVYNVVDDAPILQSECYQWLAGKLDRPLPPSGKIAPGSKRGRGNKRVRNAKLRGIGWVPRYPTFAEAMGKSILPSW